MQSKKIISVFIILIFCVALGVGGSSMFTIAEVDATYTLYSEAQKEKITEIDDILSGIEGRNLLVVKGSQLEKELESYTYLKITEIKKIFPNTLTVKISERTELFAVEREDGFYMVDDEGFVLSKKATNINNIDNLANIILDMDGELTVGSYINMGGGIKNSFGAMINALGEKLSGRHRSVVKSVKIDEYKDRITLKMAEGISINIYNASESILLKTNKALDYYLSGELTAEQKTGLLGEILIYLSDGEIVATFSPL